MDQNDLRLHRPGFPYERQLLDRGRGEPIRVFAEPGRVYVAVLPLLGTTQVFGIQIRPERFRVPPQNVPQFFRRFAVYLGQSPYQMASEAVVVERKRSRSKEMIQNRQKVFLEQQKENGISISWGYASAPDISNARLKILMRDADLEMYKCKAKMHRQSKEN